MSEMIDAAVAALNERVKGFDQTAKFVVEGEGSIMLDENGAREGDGEADVTMTADAETFRSMFEGELAPTAAFMSGKLTVDGDMGAAMKLASAMG